MDIILAIKPQFAKLIKEGKKLVELRRVSNIKIKRVFVYESSPTKMIIGYFTCKSVEHLPLDILYEKTKSTSYTPLKEFYTYFDGMDYGYGIFIENFYSGTPTDIKLFFKHPPQNYFRLTQIQSNDILEHLNLGSNPRS